MAHKTLNGSLRASECNH